MILLSHFYNAFFLLSLSSGLCRWWCLYKTPPFLSVSDSIQGCSRAYVQQNFGMLNLGILNFRFYRTTVNWYRWRFGLFTPAQLGLQFIALATIKANSLHVFGSFRTSDILSCYRRSLEVRYNDVLLYCSLRSSHAFHPVFIYFDYAFLPYVSIMPFRQVWPLACDALCRTDIWSMPASRRVLVLVHHPSTWWLPPSTRPTPSSSMLMTHTWLCSRPLDPRFPLSWNTSLHGPR